MINIITISREFDSGGRIIGEAVAEKLGVPCYDRDFIEKIAEETGYAQDYVEKESEYAPNTNTLAYMFLGRGTDGLSNADKIWIAQKKVIREVAEKGPCVIVGRCADYVLRERDDCMNVFVYADKKRKLNYKYFTEQE